MDDKAGEYFEKRTDGIKKIKSHGERLALVASQPGNAVVTAGRFGETCGRCLKGSRGPMHPR